MEFKISLYFTIDIPFLDLSSTSFSISLLLLFNLHEGIELEEIE